MLKALDEDPKRSGYNDAQIAEIEDYIEAKDMIEGAPQLKAEHLPVFENYQPDLQRADVDARTRALSHVCRVIFNLNEFAYLD